MIRLVENSVDISMHTKRLFDRLLLLLLLGFFGGFIASVAMPTSVIRPFLSWYAFSLSGLYVFRAWYWKESYDKAAVLGFLFVGLALRLIHHFS